MVYRIQFYNGVQNYVCIQQSYKPGILYNIIDCSCIRSEQQVHEQKHTNSTSTCIFYKVVLNKETERGGGGKGEKERERD